MNASPDRIEIQDLLLRCIIGIKAEERKDKQDVLINLILWGELAQAAASDNIEDAINYRTITKQIIQHVEASQNFLLERLAEQIAEICLMDRRVRRVQVRIEKPGALRFARSVGVQIERMKEET
ncbi:MAG: dihydroneopterin aldolase [Chloroflexi bacterium]|nr:dihydroneopterin aldolase [Chloroflexota bacterium]